MSSGAAKYVSFFDVHQLNEFVGGYKTYSRSKLCNILFTLELSERLKNTQVTVNSLHPGIVFTDIYREIQGLKRFLILPIMILFFKVNNLKKSSIA